MKEKNYVRAIRFFIIAAVFLFCFPCISSAYTISDSIDAPGGDCRSIGSWDNVNKKCTLSADIDDSIRIEGDGIVFDGGNYSITGPAAGVGSGLYTTGVNVIVKNVAISGFAYGISIENTSNCKVEDSILENNREGIHLNNSHYNEISGNTLRFNSNYGIYLRSSFENIIADNSAQDNGYGFNQSFGERNVYKNNIASNNTITGIWLSSGNDDVLLGNKAENNLKNGIDLAATGRFSLKNNLVSGNGKKNIFLDSNRLEEMDIDTSNISDGKKIYFVKDAANEIFDDSMNIGNFYCLNCENIILRNVTLGDKGAQVVFSQTNNSFLENVKSSDKKIEVYFKASNRNRITGCDLGKIELRDYSEENKIYGNNFSDENEPALVDISDGNLFNLALPIGGNFWKIKEATCLDANSDGFCDTRYKISLSGIDYYPLVKPFNYTPPVPTGNSNVLFLPGIKASKLYKKEAGDVENQLWTPNYFDNDLEQLALDEDGDSERLVYTQDVVEEKPVTGGDIYKTFIEKLALLKSSNVIKEYTLFAYDWRKSVEDVAQNDNLYRDGVLKKAVTEIESLANSAQNKKVTIIAHSNGGLVAKALMQELTRLEMDDKVDKIIFVGTPQMGTPLSILSLFYGYNEASPLDILISQKDSRVLVENMPGAYGLLPSEKYFERAGEENPFITFSSEHTRYKDFKNNYGTSIFGIDEFKQFLTGDGDGRIDPNANEIDLENRLNGKLISEAFAMHQRLDDWTPPDDVKVIEIAGWGLDTISGVDYAEKEDVECYPYPNSPIPSCTGIGDYEEVYEPKFTVDGDGTVVEPSALMMEEKAGSVEKYWVDLWSYDNLFTIARNHASILEVTPLQQFISNIVDNTYSSSSLPDNISNHRPDPQEYANAKPHIRMSLYSPLDINLSDGVHKTGPEVVDGQTIIREEIPNSYYHQFGEWKYVGFPSGQNINVTLNGYEAGDYTLKLEEIRETVEGEEVFAHTTFKNLPVSPKTKVFLDIPETGLADLSNLETDFDGNGEIDYSVIPVPNGEAVLPDTIAPETTLNLAGTTGDNGWYVGEVSVSLLSEDNKGGAGVASIKYILNDSVEQEYTGPFSISNEGMTSLKYFSTDNAGNQEEAKTKIIKIDKTAPEAKLIFNQAGQKIDLIGVDNLPGDVAVAVEEKIINQRVETKKGLISWIYAIIKKVNKKKQVVATFRDEAGHKTEITLEKNEFGDHFVNLFPRSILYDGVEAEFPNALLQYKWLYDSRKERYLLFGTHIKNESDLLEAHYFPKKNETWIMEKPRELDDDENDGDTEKRPAWKKLSGVIVPYLQTKQGKLKIEY